ncbi:hypothetical protein LTR36_000614 [Oleoguttula mirabilis]|uniref:2EXR domain-containing protein n=1 Tax=Oleoguttula mirabilis TaxID=1507867 RepID=A0AAV9JQI7_9PEZI|nr:hypothetical protein LTR36_000614 [Oleoguttula mirabilis]
MVEAAKEANGRRQQNEGDVSTSFRLHDLPPELRLRIYEFAVTSDGPVQLTFNDYDFNATNGTSSAPKAAVQAWKQPAAIATRTQPALSRTCKEIRGDALKLYYAQNDFEAGYCMSQEDREPEVLMAWLECIGAQSRGRLRSLKICDVHTDQADMCMEGADSTLRADLVRLGAVVEAIDGTVAVHMVTFPKAMTEE